MALDRRLQQRDAREAATEQAETIFLRETAGVDRVTAYRRWRGRCRATLLKEFSWPADETRRELLVAKCVTELQTIARQLYARGWLVNEDRLGQLVKACIAPVAKAQREGKVREFWPYFSRTVRAYVGVNAESIQHQVRRDGADVASSMAAVLGALGIPGLAKPAAPSMTEIIVEPRKRAP